MAPSSGEMPACLSDSATEIFCCKKLLEFVVLLDGTLVIHCLTK